MLKISFFSTSRLRYRNILSRDRDVVTHVVVTRILGVECHGFIEARMAYSYQDQQGRHVVVRQTKCEHTRWQTIKSALSTSDNRLDPTSYHEALTPFTPHSAFLLKKFFR